VLLAPPHRVQAAGKIRELVSKTPTRWTAAEREAFELSLISGQGRCAMHMTMAQIVALREWGLRPVSRQG